MKQKSWFDRYLEAVEKSGDITLRWWYQKQKFSVVRASA